MRIGDRSLFSAEFELNPDSGGAWLFGKLCFFAGGVRIGDYHLGTSLSDVLTLLAPIVKDSGHRFSEELFPLEGDELLRKLNRGLYEDSPDENMRATNGGWARLQVLPTLDVFNEWWAYLVDGPEYGRFVFSKTEKNAPVTEIHLPLAYFDHVARKLFDELEDLLREHEPNGRSGP